MEEIFSFWHFLTNSVSDRERWGGMSVGWKGSAGRNTSPPRFIIVVHRSLDSSWQNTYDHKKNGAKLATAALVGGDKGSFYRCAFFAYQNTLNDYSDRHYFEECQIEGAIDFIFGKARSIYAVLSLLLMQLVLSNPTFIWTC